MQVRAGINQARKKEFIWKDLKGEEIGLIPNILFKLKKKNQRNNKNIVGEYTMIRSCIQVIPRGLMICNVAISLLNK